MRETLSINNKRIEVPADYDRLVQTITLCAPTQKIELDIDVINKASLPAILESALLLIAQIETVSPTELANFFGLNEHERSVLISDMLESDLVKYNDDGDLTSTAKLVAQRRDGAMDEGISIEEVKNFRTITYIDQCTGHIQPRSEEEPQKGLPLMDRSYNNKDYSQIIVNQFDRFKASLHHNHELKNPKTRLYRINSATVIHSGLPQQVSLNIHAAHDPLNGIRLDTHLIDYKDEHRALIQKSGLISKVIDWLSEQRVERPSSTLFDYCELANDEVIQRYIKHDKITGRQYLKLPHLLHDRFIRKTSYNNQAIQMMIGPMYAPTSSNRDTVLQWVRRQSKIKRMHQGIWLGADNELFGASLGFQSFIKEMNDELKKGDRNSSINLLFQADGHGNNYHSTLQKNNTFGTRTEGKLMSFITGKTESHLEMMVFPGENGCGLIQYHAQIDPKLGLGRLTLPIGYFTTDPERVRFLWEILRARIHSKVTAFNSNNEDKTINKQLECEPSMLDRILIDHSDQRIQALIDKFNNK
ncbi:hypothetical protein CTM97_14360 [Photobacterium phosphoreum]|uniref:Uncharacterized protein n=1 Tax=Photobacterium phosphoreum TaxID=659 RepID=A0A2T3JHQ1_PHOPO|nr:hypothetical protein [Photobacterium phosphoreum]PSU22709.1 hypothetical protein CTM96_15630 [Photobacterium phosphoreum]PSU41245.1 hypothetical protein CTM97_14360 [Photobacterium phosphoreum]PSU48491.1 hypothetical protein C9J18_17370 [Photobacterium phosphoreum]